MKMSKDSGSIHRRIFSEKDQGVQARQDLLKKIGGACDNRYPVAYYTTFRFSEVMISNDDIAPLEDVLQCSDLSNGLLLLLASRGGSGLAAERIINVCRQYSSNNFEVLVPKQAKSAATMICMGANAVHMSQTSELGPIDPQIRISDSDSYIAADLLVETYEKLLSDAIKTEGRIEPFLHQLDHFNPAEIALLKREQALGDDIAVKALKQGMMSTYPESRIRQKIKPFTAARITSSHGRPINREMARRCGIEVKDIDISSELWADVMEFHLRADWFVSNSHCKLIESPDHHFSVPIGATK